MSMNLYLTAKYNSEPKHEVDFPLLQTPTHVTFKMIDAVNLKEAYISWLKSKWPNETDWVVFGQRHLEKLESFLEYHKDADIRWETL